MTKHLSKLLKTKWFTKRNGKYYEIKRNGKNKIIDKYTGLPENDINNGGY